MPASHFIPGLLLCQWLSAHAHLKEANDDCNLWWNCHGNHEGCHEKVWTTQSCYQNGAAEMGWPETGLALSQCLYTMNEKLQNSLTWYVSSILKMHDFKTHLNVMDIL